VHALQRLEVVGQNGDIKLPGVVKLGRVVILVRRCLWDGFYVPGRRPPYVRDVRRPAGVKKKVER
jgi:hypothetical protein